MAVLASDWPGHFITYSPELNFGKFGGWACSDSEEVENVQRLRHTDG
jgi:hypothetical protein